MLKRSSKILHSTGMIILLLTSFTEQHYLRTNFSENVCRGFQLDPAYFSEKVRFIEISDRKVISILAPKDNDDKKKTTTK
jgi:hypothetical protein